LFKGIEQRCREEKRIRKSQMTKDWENFKVRARC
jgi:hypothetical protein